MKANRKAYLALMSVCVLWGTTYLAMRTGAGHMPGLMLAALRQTIGGVVVVGFFLLRGARLPDLRTLARLAVIGILMLGIGNGLMSWGEQTVNSGLASMLAALNPMCIALFSLLAIRGTRLKPIGMVGLLLGLAGIVIIFYPLLEQPGAGASGIAFGTLLMLLSVVGWSSGSVLASRQPFSLNIFYVCGWEFLLGGVVLVIASAWSGQSIPLAHVDRAAWWSIGYLIAFGSLAGFSAYQYALRHLPATQVAIYAYVNPLVALVLGWWLLNEPLNWHILAGALVTLAGVYLVQRAFRKPAPPVVAPPQRPPDTGDAGTQVPQVSPVSPVSQVSKAPPPRHVSGLMKRLSLQK